MSDWLYPLAGATLLLLLAVDVFQTAFHAEGRGGPINRRQNRGIWTLIRWAGTTGGRRRDGLLALGGPLMAVTTIVVWSLLLLGGFTLVYLPYVLDFHFSPGQPGSALLEAFYYSGIITATLGHGDVVARGAPLRVLTVLQALSGFALVTVAVTYVLGIYRELVTSQALASGLDALLEPPADRDQAPAVLADHGPEWDRSVALRLAGVLESHFNYPILHYFRPRLSSRSLPPQVAKLRAASQRLEERGRGPEEEASAHIGSSSHRALRAIMGRYIAEVHSLFVQQEAEPAEGPEREAARLRQILDMMAYDDPAEADGRGSGADPGRPGARGGRRP